MTETLNIPKTDREVDELQRSSYEFLRMKLPPDGGAKVIEIKTTDKAKERANPIDPPYLLVDTDITPLSDCILAMTRKHGAQATVSTVEVYCRRKDNSGEYYNEHLVSFHQPDGLPGDHRKETITITVLGNVGVYHFPETSDSVAHLEAELVV